MSTTPLHLLPRDPESGDDAEARAVWDGLLRPLPTIDPRFFYDDRGSELFEMRLRATRPMRVTRPGDPRRLVLEAGNEIRTELSCKFTRSSFAGHLAGTGLGLERWWADPDDLFALALARPEVAR